MEEDGDRKEEGEEEPNAIEQHNFDRDGCWWLVNKKGNEIRPLNKHELKEETCERRIIDTNQLIKYFLATKNVPSSSFWNSLNCITYFLWQFFLFVWRDPGSASKAEFPFSLSNHVDFTPRLLYSSTHNSPESFTHLKTGWAQDAWLQWSYEICYFHLDTSPWLLYQGLFRLKWMEPLSPYFVKPNSIPILSNCESSWV